MIKSLLAATIAVLFAATAVAGFTAADPFNAADSALLNEHDEEEVEAEQGPPDDVGPPDGVPPTEIGPPDWVTEQVEANTAKAAARAAAARAHAEAILAWTRCIAANAANPDDEPRDDTFDPKIGCEKPAPPTDPDDPEVEDEDAGPPDTLGAPDGAGPPDWVPGPPPGEGPGSEGDDEVETE